jgi:predicted histidine transporter YuiF (NhaC family)
MMLFGLLTEIFWTYNKHKDMKKKHLLQQFFLNIPYVNLKKN